MADILIRVERDIGAPADRVYRILRDYRDHHPLILPPAFSRFRVEEGGVGAGTVIRFKVKAGGRTTAYHQRVDEPDPGRVLREAEIDGGLVTTFTVTPTGETCRTRIDTIWRARGVRGIVERFLAPRLLQPIYVEELANLDRYAREHPGL